MTEKLAKLLGNIGCVTVAGLIVVINLRSCVVSVWEPSQEPEHYRIVGQDDRVLEATFFPDRRAIFWYTDPGRRVSEGSLLYARGSLGDHYFGPIWHVRRPGSIIDFGLYPAGCRPVALELEVLAHHYIGSGNSTFPSEGSTVSVIPFCEDRIIFQDMSLTRTAVDPERIRLQLERLGAAESEAAP